MKDTDYQPRPVPTVDCVPGVEASYRDGIPEIRVPKPEQVKPKKIEIGFGDAAGAAARPPLL